MRHLGWIVDAPVSIHNLLLVVANLGVANYNDVLGVGRRGLIVFVRVRMLRSSVAVIRLVGARYFGSVGRRVGEARSRDLGCITGV